MKTSNPLAELDRIAKKLGQKNQKAVKPVAERDVVKSIRHILELKNCFVVKMHGSNFSRAGMPDLLVLAPMYQRGDCSMVLPRAVFLEVKTPSGKLSKLQAETLKKLNDLGFTAACVNSAPAALAVVFKDHAYL
jgi:hypothetical protein